MPKGSRAAQLGRIRLRRTAVGPAAALLFLIGLASALALAACDSPPLFGPAPTATPTETPVPTETPGPSPTPDPVQPDDIVYVRRFIFGLSGDLYLVHPSGLAPRQITPFTRDQSSAASDYPVWSPDRQSIAFASEYRDLYNLAIRNLYTIDPEGKGAQQITGLPQPNNGYFPPMQSDIPGVSRWALLTPPPGVQVRGRVLASGRPAAGAVVVSWLGRGFATTDANGMYTLADVPPGRGWIKATGAAGAGWTWVEPTMGTSVTAPDITLDPRLSGAEYASPGWDPRGGLWSLYRQHWFDPLTHEPIYESRLVHMQVDGTDVREIYTAKNITLGRPRANPAHPEQVAIVDGTDLLLLNIDLQAPAGKEVTSTQVLRRNVLRNSPIAWSPDGQFLYVVEPSPDNPDPNAGYELLLELHVATGATRPVTTFWPKELQNTGFDLSPDGTQVVYEENGDLFTRSISAPPTAKSKHITYYGQGSQPTWGGH